MLQRVMRRGNEVFLLTTTSLLLIRCMLASQSYALVIVSACWSFTLVEPIDACCEEAHFITRLFGPNGEECIGAEINWSIIFIVHRNCERWPVVPPQVE